MFQHGHLAQLQGLLQLQFDQGQPEIDGGDLLADAAADGIGHLRRGLVLVGLPHQGYAAQLVLVGLDELDDGLALLVLLEREMGPVVHGLGGEVLLWGEVQFGQQARHAVVTVQLAQGGGQVAGRQAQQLLQDGQGLQRPYSGGDRAAGLPVAQGGDGDGGAGRLQFLAQPVQGDVATGDGFGQDIGEGLVPIPLGAGDPLLWQGSIIPHECSGGHHGARDGGGAVLLSEPMSIVVLARTGVRLAVVVPLQGARPSRTAAA